MSRAFKLSVPLLLVAMLAAVTAGAETTAPSLSNPPAGFVPPPLHPGDTRLETVDLGDGVYALVSNLPAVDNSGFVVGEKGVLVIDSHINGAMARQIQAAVGAVTDKPILYLINTNYHGDHTFGNYAFGPEVTVIAHRETARQMRDFEHEKQVMLATVQNDRKVFGDARLRLPDLVFTDFLAIDLGGRTVQLYHFGKGNTAGDTVVFEPATRTAWTGNLVVGEGTIPPIFEGDVSGYLATLSRFRTTLEVARIVPGHGGLTDGRILGRYLAYLSQLIDTVGIAETEGRSLAQVQQALPLDHFVPMPQELAASPAGAFLSGLHRLNLAQAYYEAARR